MRLPQLNSLWSYRNSRVYVAAFLVKGKGDIYVDIQPDTVGKRGWILSVSDFLATALPIYRAGVHEVRNV